MTIQERKVMKLALEALEDIANEIYGSWTNGEKAQRIAQNLIPTIKEALAQPQQEPVAIPRFGLNPDNGMMYESKRGPWCLFKDIPPQRKPFNHHEFGYWWFEYGSGLHPLEGEDQEEHAYRVATAAWQAAHNIKGEA